MRELSARGVDRIVRERVKEGTPLLGVCVGCRCFLKNQKSLGRLRIRFAEGSRPPLSGESSRRFVVPQVGWNQVRQRGIHPLLAGIEDDAFFYFRPFLFLEAMNPSVVIGETDYGRSIRR